MEIKVSNMIELPTSYFKYINKKAYIYMDYSRDTTISTIVPNGDTFLLPRNIGKFIQNFNYTDFTISRNFIDTPFTSEYKVKSGFILRDAQKEILNKLFKAYESGHYDNIITLGTGGGKTAMLPYLLSKINNKTLILVDLKLLQDQMVEAFEAFTDYCDIQVIGKGVKRVADVNIATVQFLNRNKGIVALLKKEIGCVVLDECHITAADTIKNIIQHFPAKYRIGLSATPTRSDGLTEVLTDVFGNKITGVTTQSIPIEAMVLSIKQTLKGSFKHYNDLIKYLINKYLNQHIDTIINYYCKIENRSIMLAVNNVELQTYFKQKYKEYNAEIINGDTNKKRKEEILNRYDKGEVKLLIGYKVLEKGVNIPRMGVLVNVLSASTKEKIEQLLGRLNREHKEKDKAIYIDFVFPYILRKQYTIKVKTLKALANKLNLSGGVFPISKEIERMQDELTKNK